MLLVGVADTDQEAIDVNEQAEIDALAALAKIGGGP